MEAKFKLTWVDSNGLQGELTYDNDVEAKAAFKRASLSDNVAQVDLLEWKECYATIGSVNQPMRFKY